MYSNSQPEKVNIPVIVSRQFSSNSADSQIDTGPIRPPCASRSLVIVSLFFILIYRKTPLIVPGVGPFSNANINALDQHIAETKADLESTICLLLSSILH